MRQSELGDVRSSASTQTSRILLEARASGPIRAAFAAVLQPATNVPFLRPGCPCHPASRTRLAFSRWTTWCLRFHVDSDSLLRVAFDNEIVLHGKCAGHLFRGHICLGVFHLAGNNTFKRDRPVLHHDMNRRVYPGRVALQTFLAVNRAVQSEPELVVRA